jgi:adenylyltransferase/sulfurtransferase
MDPERYSRQIMIFGEEGQKKLSKSKVLVIGAGGLGSPVIAYLAAAGVGELGIVDGDVVEISNLQRQVIHAGNVGKNKALSAEEFVERLNPDVRVVSYPYSLTPKNVTKIIDRYDVVVGCPDNFRLRYILNDACMLNSVPYVHGAVYSFEGEVMTITKPPCYRCYLPRAPEEHGRAIIGATAGVFGSLQAVEVIKLLTGYGEVLEGRVLRGDLYSMEFFEIEVSVRDDCPVCSGKLKGIFEENYVGRSEILRYE